MSKAKKVKHVIKKLPEQKHYFEFIAAVLTIPVLITVILLNLNNLSQNKAARITPVPTQSPREIIINGSSSQPLEVTPTSVPNPTTTNTPAPTSPVCQKAVGPVAVSYPQEGQTVTDNPICFIFNHDDTDYCSVVYSYRINGSSYSNFSGNAPCIYNLPNGPVEFDLRIQSTASQDQAMITRKFIYQGNTQGLSPTPTP